MQGFSYDQLSLYYARFSNTTALGTSALFRNQRGQTIRRSDRTTPLFAIKSDQSGFLRLTPNATTRYGTEARLLDDPVNFPAIMPGPKADVSVGLAIAHFKASLQDVVRAAQTAEKRAKHQLGRAAVAVSLFKRSGEITEWGCRWEDGGLTLYRDLARALEDGQLTAKFPHRLCEILRPFISNSEAITDLAGFPTREVVSREFARLLTQHEGKALNRAPLTAALDAYLASLAKHSPSDIARQVIGLATAVAFAHRTR